MCCHPACKTPGESNGLLTCELCGDMVHRSCLGLGKHAYAASMFSCAICVLVSVGVKLAGPPAWEAADSYIKLRAYRVQQSSAATYSAALNRFVKFCQEELNLPAERILPQAPGRVISTQLVLLFLAEE